MNTIKIMKCEGFYGDCGNFGSTRRQNTQYSDDKENFRVLCNGCQKESEEYWKMRWEEYYYTR